MIRIMAILLAATTSLTFAANPPAAQPKPARAARSVHLAYSLPQGTDAADAFYNEVVVERSTPGSYFMAAGFGHGYFGIQELAGGRKVVLFSVWDPAPAHGSGGGGDDAEKIPRDQRVEVLHHDPDVEVKRFGGEGTGGQSFFPYDWKIGQRYRFLVRAKVEADKTAYSAYFFLPENRAWKHLVTFRTRTSGGGGEKLAGLYSFIEDFRRDTQSATETRRALFGNGWIQSGADWKPLTTARFTASDATWEAKDTIDAGVVDSDFYLQTGGPTKTTTPLNSTLTRPVPPGAESPGKIKGDLPTSRISADPPGPRGS